MSVKFEFTLSDEDASNLIFVLQEAKIQAMSRAFEFHTDSERDKQAREWHNEHARYLEELKQKVWQAIKELTK